MRRGDALHLRHVRVDNGRRLPHGTIDRRQVAHVRLRVRGNDDGRTVGMEGARRHGILVVLGLDVWVHAVPVRLRIRRGLGMCIVRHRVRGVGIVVNRRVRLGREIVLVVTLPPPRMERQGRRYRVAGHHGRQTVLVLPSPLRRPETKQRTSEATGEAGELAALCTYPRGSRRGGLRWSGRAARGGGGRGAQELLLGSEAASRELGKLAGGGGGRELGAAGRILSTP